MRPTSPCPGSLKSSAQTAPTIGLRRMNHLFLVLLLAGCPDSPATTDDLGTSEEDAGIQLDSGSVEKDAATDAEVDGGEADTGTPDAGDAGPPDMGPADTGLPPLMQELAPGSHVQAAEGRVDIGMTFTEVNALLGAGTRSAGANARSYEWTLPSGPMLTVWFGNTNLDDDDQPPNDVDGTDEVLWIAVQNFTGETPEGIALGDPRTEVETAYGAPPNEVVVPNPAGTLSQYFTTGLLVAFAPDDTVRTLTVCRAYVALPDGEIDVDDARIRLSTGDIRGIRSLVQRGTDDGDVIARLGEPDSRGNVTIGGQDLELFSYGFIGIQVFFPDNDDRVLFVSVHAPYYGTTAGGPGLGSTRTEVEAFLSGQGYDNGTPSSTPELICYDHGSDPMVGVTYSANGEASSFTLPIPLDMCP